MTATVSVVGQGGATVSDCLCLCVPPYNPPRVLETVGLSRTTVSQRHRDTETVTPDGCIEESPKPTARASRITSHAFVSVAISGLPTRRRANGSVGLRSPWPAPSFSPSPFRTFAHRASYPR